MLKTIIINSEIQLTADVVFESKEEDTRFNLYITSIAMATHNITMADTGVILEK